MKIKSLVLQKDDIGTNIDNLTDELHGIDAMYTLIVMSY